MLPRVKTTKNLNDFYDSDDEIEFQVINLTMRIDKKGDENGYKTNRLTQLSQEFAQDCHQYLTSSKRAVHYNRRGIKCPRVRFRPTMVAKACKNESISEPEECETEDSILSDDCKLEKYSTHQSPTNTSNFDTNATTSSVGRLSHTTPMRVSYKDKILCEKKLEFLLKSANRMARDRRAASQIQF